MTGARRNPFASAEVAGAYDAWFESPLGATVDRLEKRLIARLAAPRAGQSALDVGTGTGHYAAYLDDLGLRVTGIDASPAMLEVARARPSDVAWQEGDAAALPYPADSFDLVLSVTMLEFVPDPAAALAEMYRVLRPGGRLVAAVLNARSPWGRARQREALEADTPFRRAHFFQPGEFASLLGRLGQAEWSSAVFLGPYGGGLRYADLLERLGQAFWRGRGALLVGRVSK
jgi:ubiquinone/menaquinone biosynthesis C-methylase UbiE